MRKGNKARKIDFLPDRLRQVMQEKRFSRVQLCNAAGLSKDTFDGYMRTGKIMPDILEQICSVLNCDEDFIAGFEEEDRYFSKTFKKADMLKDIELTTKISKPDFFATLFELYDFPPEVIRSIKNDPFSGSARGSYVIWLLDDFMERLKKEEQIRFYSIEKERG